ncbi:MAG TPA: histidine kinase, partial [Chitinophagaceae bacterium]|nr:histidine kinase [Chitinophagaceae bacterium]
MASLLTQAARASDSLAVHSLAEIDSVPVMEQASFFVDPTNQLDWKDIIRRPFEERPGLTRYIDSTYGRKRVTLWLRFTVQNEMNDSLKLMILFHRYAYFRELIMVKGDDTQIVRPDYFYTHLTKQIRKNVSRPMASGETISFLVRIYNPYANLFADDFLITNRKAYLNARMRLYHSSYPDYIFQTMFLSVVLFITLHTMVQYFVRRRKEFVFYALYSFSVLLFFLYHLEFSIYYDILFSYFPYIYKFANNPLSIMVYYTYFRFAREFVDFKKLFPWFYTVIIWTERLLIAAFIADLLCDTLLNNYALREMIFTSLRIILLLISFVGIYLLLRSGKKTLYFFGTGSLLLIVGSMLAMIYTFYPEANTLFKNDSIRFMQIGIVLELLCFTSGLSYKSYLIEIEKRNVQEQLIRQLEENRRLQTELTTRLETRVKEQTEQILSQQQLLEREKENKLTLEFTKKITEMELQLLKSQLNPHFYFNTLHNLYGLAMIAPKKAPDAILKLSDIMEYVIYDCRNDKVPVAKELRFINSYIELEKLRYDDAANIRLKITGDSDGKLISPLLLIQFIENAFKHGMEQYKRGSYLEVNIVIENGSLHYESVNS